MRKRDLDGTHSTSRMVSVIIQIKVVTVSASFKVAGSLDLNEVVRYYGGRYEPELFPAAMFTKDSVHFTCFHTGSVLMTVLNVNVNCTMSVYPF